MNKILCASILVCATMNQAYAAHPLVTDDTGVQGEGAHQLEANADWGHQAGAANHVGSFTYTYGLTDQLDLFGNVPMTFRSPQGNGPNDASIGLKWRFFDREGLSLGIKPELFAPTGDATKGLGNGKSGAAVTGLLSYEIGKWTWHGNLGLNYNSFQLQEDKDDKRKWQWRASTAAWYAINPQWKLVGDVGVMRNIERANRTWPAYALLGVIWSPNETLDLDAGAKFGLNKAEITRQLGLGLTLHY